MSIGPIESFPPAESSQPQSPSVLSPNATAHSISNTPKVVALPLSGSGPKQENSTAKNSPAVYELPEDVVEVHQDPQDKGQVIIEYLDKAKNIILQVPSPEELAVERGIAQEFQQAAKLRSISAGQSAGQSEEEDHHGN